MPSSIFTTVAFTRSFPQPHFPGSLDSVLQSHPSPQLQAYISSPTLRSIFPGESAKAIVAIETDSIIAKNKYKLILFIFISPFDWGLLADFHLQLFSLPKDTAETQLVHLAQLFSIDTSSKKYNAYFCSFKQCMVRADRMVG
jgi:hypothetical protein